MSSLDFIAESIRSDKPEQVLAPGPGKPVVSANLCDALVEIQSQTAGSALTVSVKWSGGDTTPRVPSKVRLPHEYISFVETLSTSLRQSVEPRRDSFVVLVDELRGELGDDGRLQGEVVLSVFVENEGAVPAKAYLTAEQYEVAWRSHNPSDYTYVLAVGTLRRGRRLSSLNEIKTFEIVQPRTP